MWVTSIDLTVFEILMEMLGILINSRKNNKNKRTAH